MWPATPSSLHGPSNLGTRWRRPGALISVEALSVKPRGPYLRLPRKRRHRALSQSNQRERPKSNLSKIPGPEQPLVDGVESFFRKGVFRAFYQSIHLFTLHICDSRYPCIRPKRPGRTDGRIQSLLQGFHDATCHPHCSLSRLHFLASRRGD